MNLDQNYLELPAETKMSLDYTFMTITSFNGEIKLIKLPPIINPLRDDETAAA
jgi:hypothetical protein